MRDTEITRAWVELVERPGPSQPFVWRDGLPGSEPRHTAGVLHIETAGGVVGSAEVPRGRILEDLVARRIADEIVGADAMRREWLWHRMWELDRIEEFPLYILGIVDIALWDIAGKVAGRPVHELLGGYRESIPAYASTVTYSSISEYLDIADQCIERGFSAIKLHAWGDARRDAALSQSLRDHVGDSMHLMYDGSAAFDLPDAVYLGRALSDAGYTWYEEPMREFNIASHRWLAERVDVPLLVAETSDGVHMNAADFIHQGAATHVRTSAGLKGGITGGMRIAHLAEAFHLRAEVHGMGMANQHLCMAIPRTTYYESLVWGNPIETDPSVGRDGVLPAPVGPGLGRPALVAG